ncbi:hypothetical protein HZB00_02750 [Candidatus Woesearchaeota archaeon]|nr:hypothetical protein [Candidatus Woesearchaeota archaeon]
MDKERSLFLWPMALAFSFVTGIVYLACAFLLWLFPQGSMSIFRYWFHGIDLTKIAATSSFGFGGLFIGLLTSMLFAGIIGALFALSYNLCIQHCKKFFPSFVGGTQ